MTPDAVKMTQDTRRCLNDACHLTLFK